MPLTTESSSTPLEPLPASTDGATVANATTTAPGPGTETSMTDSSRPALPELPYSLRDHKRNIAIIWSLLALDVAIMPLALFYPLWYASGLAPAYIFAVTTGVFGIITGIEWAYRGWRLYRQEWVRPFGGKRNGVRGVLMQIFEGTLTEDGNSSISFTSATPSATPLAWSVKPLPVSGVLDGDRLTIDAYRQSSS